MKISAVLAVSVIAGLMVAPASAEYLTNGDFDTGDISPWVPYEIFGGGPMIGQAQVMTAGSVWAPTPNEPTSGSYMAGRAAATNMSGQNNGAYQTVAVPMNEPLTLSFDVTGGVGGFGNFDGTGWWEVRINEGGWVNPDAGEMVWKRELNGDGGFGWEHVAAPYTSTTGMVTVQFKYGAWDPQWDYTYFGAYWDSFSLVPEPATALLLALGFPLLRRRR